MDSELRKVTFTLGVPEFLPGLSPQDEKEHEVLTREREGVFHVWAKKEGVSPQSGNFLEITYALIEETSTGNIHYVLPELMNFVKE